MARIQDGIPWTDGSTDDNTTELGTRNAAAEDEFLSEAEASGTYAALLAEVEYDPVVQVSVSTTSTSLVDIDAALSVTFTPISDEVVVVLNGMSRATTGSDYCRWGLRDGAADVATSLQSVIQAASTIERQTYRKRFAGLTPGTPYTWKWAVATSNAGTTALFAVGGAAGFARMEVWSA